MLDLYCERIGPGLLAEPLNAFTNLAFLLAAYLASRDIKKHRISNKAWWLLPLLMAATGLGSLLFHLFANPISQMLDLVALLLYQLVFLWFYSQLLNGLSGKGRIVFMLLFLLSVYTSSSFPHLFNGSLLYAPTLLILLGMSVYHFIKYPSSAVNTMLATGLFTMSLVARSVDLQVCDAWSAGTHFLWHLGNAIVMLMMFRVLLNLSMKGSHLQRQN